MNVKGVTPGERALEKRKGNVWCWGTVIFNRVVQRDLTGKRTLGQDLKKRRRVPGWRVPGCAGECSSRKGSMCKDPEVEANSKKARVAGAKWACGVWQGMRPVEGVGVLLCTAVKEGKPSEGLKQIIYMTLSFKKGKSVGGCVESSPWAKADAGHPLGGCYNNSGKRW